MIQKNDFHSAEIPAINSSSTYDTCIRKQCDVISCRSTEDGERGPGQDRTSHECGIQVLVT